MWKSIPRAVLVSFVVVLGTITVSRCNNLIVGKKGSTNLGTTTLGYRAHITTSLEIYMFKDSR